MIKIQVIYHNSEFRELKIQGHAKAADKGQDIVCAAVSAVSEGGVQALTDDEKSYEFEMKEGYLDLKRIAPNMSEHDKTVMMTIVTQLESIALVSKNHVQLERKQQ